MARVLDVVTSVDSMAGVKPCLSYVVLTVEDEEEARQIAQLLFQKVEVREVTPDAA